MVVGLAVQLDEVLDADDSPSLTRLFPTAYPDDAELDAGYQVLARGELIDNRRESIQLMTRSAEKLVLSEEELSAWMRIVNDLRLVLGTQLDVGEGEYEIGPDDPNSEMTEVYHFLGAVLSEIVDGMAGALPTNLD